MNPIIKSHHIAQNLINSNYSLIEMNLNSLYHKSYIFNKLATAKVIKNKKDVTEILIIVKASIEFQKIKKLNIEQQIKQTNSGKTLNKLYNKILSIQDKLIKLLDQLEELTKHKLITSSDILNADTDYIEVCKQINLLENYLDNSNNELLNLKYFN